MSGPVTINQKIVRFSKAGILAALQQAYPVEFGNKTLDMLDSYGPEDFDPTFMRFVFKEVDVDGVEANIEIIRFQQGGIIQLMQAIDPTHFSGVTINDIEYYQDDEVDPTKVKFVFKEVIAE